MGIDLIRGGRIANRGFRATKSGNSYLKSLINVITHLFSFTHSSQEELMPNLTKSSTNVSTNQDSIVTPSPFHALSSIFPMTALPLSKAITNSSVLSQLLALLLTMSGSLTYPKDLELWLWGLPKPPEIESLLPREAAWLSTNLLNLPPLAKMSCCLEAPEIEKPRGISVSAPDRKAPTLLPASDQSAENSKWLEAEDDPFLFNITNHFINS